MKIAVLTGVLARVQTGKEIKALSFLYVLKAKFPAGCIPGDDPVLKLRDVLGLGAKSIKNRLKDAQKEGLINKRGAYYYLPSWADIRAHYSITSEKKHYAKIKTTVETLVRALKIEYIKRSQDKALKQYFKQQSPGPSFEKWKDAEVRAQLNRFKYNRDQDVSQVRTDTEASQDRISKAMGLNSQAAAAYWVKKLEGLKEITKQSRRVVSQVWCKSSILGHCFYSRSKNVWILQMPDKLTFLA